MQGTPMPSDMLDSSGMVCLQHHRATRPKLTKLSKLQTGGSGEQIGAVRALRGQVGRY